MLEFSCCRRHTCVLLQVATGRGSGAKMLVRQNAGFGHAGIFGLETCETSGRGEVEGWWSSRILTGNP